METPWREVVEQTCLGVWIIDSQDRTVYVNDRLTALFGLLPAEMVHRNLPEIIDTPESVRLLTCLKQSHRMLTDFLF